MSWGRTTHELACCSGPVGGGRLPDVARAGAYGPFEGAGMMARLSGAVVWIVVAWVYDRFV